jgi:hypothetical protein
MVFYEEKRAKILLEQGTQSFVTYEDLSILAKYFKYIGKNKTQIEKSLIEFCEKNICNFNEILFRDKIENAINSCDKFGIRLHIDVPITNSELEIVKNCGDYKRQKILFVMLAVAKYFKYNDTRLTPKKNNNHDDDFYVNIKWLDILKMAKVNVSKVGRRDIIYDLEQSELITLIKRRNGGVSFQVNFIDENSESIIIINNMDDIISFYYFNCEKCGNPIKDRAKRHDLCEECYKEHKKELGRNRFKKHYYKNLTK